LQEAIRSRLTTPLEITSELRSRLLDNEREFLEELARRMPTPTARAGAGTARLRPELFPPCIRKMRRMLQQGENLSHAGRFALAAFLYRAGADMETMVDQYRGAPDFDEGITRYQLEHITRHGGGAGYEPPECATLRSHGLCFREGDPGAREAIDRERDARCFEATLRHPLQYYRNRGGAVVARAPAATG
jgi:DNA primase large subunit